MFRMFLLERAVLELAFDPYEAREGGGARCGGAARKAGVHRECQCRVWHEKNKREINKNSMYLKQ